MRLRHAPAIAPTAAERVRSILATAHSLTVVSDGVHTDVRRLDGEKVLGHFHLHAPGEGTAAPGGRRVPVRLELTDIAPTPVRERVRARVTLTGLLAAPYDPAAEGSVCMEFGQAILEDAEERAYVTLGELEVVEPDPVAAGEAGMLTHLLEDHPEYVPLLLRLVRPRPEPGVLRALPVRMDRYGIVLRMEYAHAHRDVRLPFRTPVSHADHIGPQVHSLLTSARRAAHPGRLLS
ncbi:DUF2470 domain-containing protein [Streptomyces qinglanensis]|uniref:DUF2470 domain-containing protein n=1 Tax=Streptomyces qinglanensis TaxID=943816 RepID=UPI003D72C9D0